MSTATTTAVRTLSIDKAHSEVAFQVRHLLTRVTGRFSDFSGTIQFDDEHPELTAVNVSIQAGSIDTNEPKRDAHLRSDDFFGVETHPTLTFTSTRVRVIGPRQYELDGDLTMRGIARRIVLTVNHLGSAIDPWGNRKEAFEAEGVINRKDWGLNWNAALETGGFLVGDEVRLVLSVQAA